ncbi:hypothetical protein [Paracoccus aminovorans]|uniref:hypothetical protein n=1 Tax=Paracoccus aminovorans TaxID=34004 RepID=UPI0007822E92|nr:hypothetical protein [Paracoccus aminovorans]MDQ7777522.1 hypothetical protein [Paracoccus aminovorans]
MTGTPEGQKPAPQRRRHGRGVSFFFWLTIGVLVIGTGALAVLGAMRQPDPAAAPVAVPENSQASKRTRFEEMLAVLPQKVREEIQKHLDEALDRIFQPAFDGIPRYAKFHYSLRGEYSELLGAALPKSETALQQYVFNGMDQRLKDETAKLNQKFGDLYIRQLQDVVAKIENGKQDPGFDHIVQTIKTDLMQRVSVTAPVASAASTVAALAATKVASKTVAKKLGATIAKKVAAKGTTKVGGVLTGAGSGAAACSWSGPIAAACGAGGAVIAWVAIDKAIIELDEYFNREEFEDELRADIVEQKQAVRAALEKALTDKSKEMEGQGKRVAHGKFTAYELTQGGSAAMCEKAKELLDRYDALRSNAALRQGTAVNDLRDEVEGLQTLPALKEIANEMLPVLTNEAATVELYGMGISGYLPPDLRENRDLSGTATVNDVAREIERFEASEDVAFRAPVRVSGQGLRPGEMLRVKLTLEQHRRFFSNRHFAGETELPVDDLIADMGPESDTPHQVSRNMALALDEDGDGKAEPGAPWNEIEVWLALRAQSLPPITSKGCPAP